MKPVSELSDAALSELFAVKVAGWFPAERGCKVFYDPEGGHVLPHELPAFATSSDAVLPWLEGWGDYCATFGIDYEKTPVTKVTVLCAVTRGTHTGKAIGPNGFPRAACIAHLAANGITEVES